MGGKTAASQCTVAWSDDFDGPANSSVNPEYWEFDTGQGIFGTKEIERVTASTANVRLDGREYFSVSESAVEPAVWTHAFDHGFSILLNVAIGGTFPNAGCRCDTPAAGTTSGGEMVVRDVAVYTRQDAGRAVRS